MRALLLLCVARWVLPAGGISADKLPHTVCRVSSSDLCSMSSDRFGVGNTTEVFPGDPSTRCVESAEPYSFSFTKRDSHKLHLNFQGGGVCWNQQTYDDGRCRRYSATPKRDGILDTDNQESAFANYSVVVIHYCSSDYFLGNGTSSTMTDSQNETVLYNGIANTMSVLRYVASQQAENEYLSETLEHLLISGTSVGAIAAPLWLKEITRYISALSYSVIGDSLVLNMPETYQPEFFSMWGFCGSLLMPDEYAEDCLTRNISHIDLQLLTMKNYPEVTFITVTSKRDNTATAAYNRFIEDKGGTTLWPSEFYEEVLLVLERLNQQPNYIAYVVSGFNHLYLTRSRYYEATEYGDNAYIIQPRNGTALYLWLANLTETLPSAASVASGSAAAVTMSSLCHIDDYGSCGISLLPKSVNLYSTRTSSPTGAPSCQPTVFPSALPSGVPTSSRPSYSPSREPTVRPSSSIPSASPSHSPSNVPSCIPSCIPTHFPSNHPTFEPSERPTFVPSFSPSGLPSKTPFSSPSGSPSFSPSIAPSYSSSSSPSLSPSIYPSTWPSSGPSYSPSSFPSSFPSSYPSRSPLSMPLSTPSSTPSSCPSKSPSIYPSSFPLSPPSTYPSHSPSTPPSVVPSTLPSLMPNSLPTIIPSNKLTVNPSCEATSLSSFCPSNSPSAQPSQSPLLPSLVPSHSPHSYPSIEPSSSSTFSPSTTPTKSPSLEPSYTPTQCPSLGPTLIPSDTPSCVPISVPSSIPSKRPSFYPLSSPSSHPSLLPSQAPSLDPTVGLFNSNATIASRRMIAFSKTVSNGTLLTSEVEWSTFVSINVVNLLLLNIPVSLTLSSCECHGMNCSDCSNVICEKKYLHNDPLENIVQSLHNETIEVTTQLCNGIAWSVGFCASGLPVLCFNCSDPCSNLNYEGRFSISYDNLYRGSFQKVLTLEYDPIFLPPSILSMTVSSEKGMGLSVFVTTSGKGSVKCLAALSSLNHAPVDSTFTALDYVLLDDYDYSANVSISNLEASSKFDVFCTTYSTFGVAALQYTTKFGVYTACCREISVSLTSPYFTDYSNSRDALQISVGAIIADAMMINVSAFTSGNTSNSSVLHSPFVTLEGNSYVIFNNSLTSPQRLAYSHQPAGSYLLSLQLSGPSSNMYELVYPHGRKFEVISSSYSPDHSPELSSAVFAEDGRSIEIRFNMDTNHSLNPNSGLDCTKLLQIRGLYFATKCEWKSASFLKLYIGGDSAATVGDTVILLRGVMKAKCILPSCDELRTNEESSVLITAPLFIAAPVVSIVGASTIGPCDDMTIDMSASTGSGGRTWSSITWSVAATHSNASEILGILNAATNTSFLVPIIVPKDLLQSNEAYYIVAKFCNFLGGCSRGDISFSVGAVEHIPVVSLSVPKVFSSFRHLPLSISGSSIIQFCNGSSSSSNLRLSWDIIDRTESQSSVSSISVDPSVFLVSSNQLQLGHVYEVVLTAQHNVTMKYSSESTFVSIHGGDIVAKSNISAVTAIRISETLVIDASSSFDEGRLNNDLILAADYEFHFQCTALSANIFDPCRGMLAQQSKAIVTFSVPNNRSFIGKVFEVKVRVRNVMDMRFSDIYIEIHVLAQSAASVSLALAKVGKRFHNPGDILVIDASTHYSTQGLASWRVNDDFIDIDAVSLSHVEVILPQLTNYTVQNYDFSLVFSGNVLRGGDYLFTLDVVLLSGEKSTSSIRVEVNSPPLEGLFVVTPSKGIALQTPFLFMASQWMDSDLPLEYEYATYSTVISDYLVFRSRQVHPTAKVGLIAGQAHLLYKYTTRVQVYDVLDGKSTSYTSVQVETDTSLKAVSDVSNIFTSANNVAQWKQVTHTVAGLLNIVNCGNAGNCSELNRSPCGISDHVCGFCLDGFYGENRPSNSMCYSGDDLRVEVSTHPSLGSVCVNDVECAGYLFQECRSNSYCDYSLKTCQNNCSGHGECVQRYLYASENGNSYNTQDCTVLDNSCERSCVCFPSYEGDTCDMETNEFHDMLLKRELLLQTFSKLMQYENPSYDTIVSWARGLSSVATSSTQLTNSGKSILILLTQKVVEWSEELNIPFQDVCPSLFKILDLILTSNSTGSVDESLSLLRKVGLFAVDSMVPGQHHFTAVGVQFRMSAFSLTAHSERSMSYSLDISADELIHNFTAPSIMILPTSRDSVAQQSILLMETALYTHSSSIASLNHQSVPFSVVVNGHQTQAYGHQDDSGYRITVNLRNYDFGSNLVNSSQEHTTQCTLNENFSAVYECLSGVNVTAYCNGTMNGTIVTACPIQIPISLCNSLSSSALQCDVAAFSIDSTMCQCSSGYTDNVDAVLTSVGSFRFTEPIHRFFPSTSTPHSNEGVSVENRSMNEIIALIVILLSLLTILFLLPTSSSRNNVVSPSGSIDVCMVILEKNIPSIFSSKSFVTRLYDEISMYHPWSSFLKRINNMTTRRWRFLFVLCQLNIAFLMQYLVLEYGMEKGSFCKARIDEESCHSQGSFYEGSCCWEHSVDGEDGCSHQEPSFHEWVYICLFASALCFLTPPIFCSIEALSAPIWHCRFVENYDLKERGSSTAPLKEEYAQCMSKLNKYSSQLPHDRRKQFQESWDRIGDLFTVFVATDTAVRLEKESLRYRPIADQVYRLMMLFMKDMMSGVELSYFQLKDSKHQGALYQKYVSNEKFGLIMFGRVSYIGGNFIICAFVMLRAWQASEERQRAWVCLFIFWAILEVGVVSTLKTLIIDVMLPSCFRNRVTLAKNKLHQYLLNSTFRNNSFSLEDFNAAPQFYSSVRLASILPDNFECEDMNIRVSLLSFQSPWPCHHNNIDEQIEDSNSNIWSETLLKMIVPLASFANGIFLNLVLSSMCIGLVVSYMLSPLYCYLFVSILVIIFGISMWRLCFQKDETSSLNIEISPLRSSSSLSASFDCVNTTAVKLQFDDDSENANVDCCDLSSESYFSSESSSSDSISKSDDVHDIPTSCNLTSDISDNDIEQDNTNLQIDIHNDRMDDDDFSFSGFHYL